MREYISPVHEYISNIAKTSKIYSEILLLQKIFLHKMAEMANPTKLLNATISNT